MLREQAVGFASDLLLWLAGSPERIGPLLDASGAPPGALRARASDPEFLGFCLDFAMSDEALLVEGCRACGLDPQLAAAARAALPGGDAPHWT